jgi:hypothetical protein
MLVTITVRYKAGVFGKSHNIQDEGDLTKAISDTIAEFRIHHPEISLLDASISIER